MKIKIGEQTFDVKTSFSELSYSDYAKLLEAENKPLMDRLSVYASIPLSVINSLPIQSVGQILELVSFVENKDLLAALANPSTIEKYLSPIERIKLKVNPIKSIGSDTYFKFARAQQLLKGRNYYVAIVDVIKLYHGVDLGGKKLLDVWNIVVSFSNELQSFMERFKEMGDYKHGDEELEAGVERFESFGFFPTVVKIGRERGLKNNEVLEVSAMEIMNELLLDYVQSKYLKDLHDIQKRNSDHLNKST